MKFFEFERSVNFSQNMTHQLLWMKVCRVCVFVYVCVCCKAFVFHLHNSLIYRNTIPKPYWRIVLILEGLVQVKFHAFWGRMHLSTPILALKSWVFWLVKAFRNQALLFPPNIVYQTAMVSQLPQRCCDICTHNICTPNICPSGQLSPWTTVPLDKCSLRTTVPQDNCPPGHMFPRTSVPQGQVSPYSTSGPQLLRYPTKG